MNHPIRMLLAALICLAPGTAGLAQRGMGDSSGVVRQGLQPEIVSLAGTLVDVKTGPCESTTGRSPVGTHLLLATPEGPTLNIHLGPAAVVGPIVAKLVVGQPVSARVFRTDKMPENHYVAQSLTFGGTTVALRKDNLQPVWAQGPARGQGRGAALGLRGAGRGKAMGGGRLGPGPAPGTPGYPTGRGPQGSHGAMQR